MPVAKLTAFVLGAGLVAGCGDDAKVSTPPDADLASFPVTDCTKVATTPCTEIHGGDAAALQDAVNSMNGSATLVLGKGTFALSNQLLIRTRGAHIIGQGIDVTTLDFGPVTAQVSAGVDAMGDDFLIQDLTVLDSPKDGIRVEASNGVVYRRIRATWTNASLSTNGAYGIYPVHSQNVLVENSRAENAADAGLYVGQCQHVIVRNNTVTGNVAGLEIENVQYADVYGNTAEDNTGGILVFDLPGNPIVGRDIRLHDNLIRNNNHVNFAAGGTVATIPVGTGTFAMASRRVEITGNTYQNNNSSDISLISGKVVEPDPTKWTLDKTKLAGTFEDLGLLSPEVDGVPDKTRVMNFRSENIVVSGNTHAGSGTRPDPNDPGGFGLLFMVQYQGQPVDSVLYDTWDENGFDSLQVGLNTNDNHICVGGNTAGTFASMALLRQLTEVTPPAFYRPAAPFPPFDCITLNGGAIAAVELP
jgi:parallel beta-helix repeat protein